MNTRALLLLAFLASAASLPAAVTFRFACRNMGAEENFFAKTSDSKVIASARVQLKLPIASRNMIVGKVARGAEENFGWSWHFQEGWDFAEMAIEVCDARPSYVEKNLDAWLQSPGSFCPWASYVSGELPTTIGVLEGDPALQARPGSQSLSFRLTRAADVSLELRRIDGGLVSRSRNPHSAGDHTLAVDTRGLARGVYRLVLRADGLTLSAFSHVIQ